MYDELVKRVRQVAEEVCDDYDVDPYIAEQRSFVIEEAADAIEKLSAYARQLEDLRKDGYYLQKTKMMTYGQARMTMPLPEPPKEKPTCEDCQRECQMMGLDMEVCASYKPPKEG